MVGPRRLLLGAVLAVALAGCGATHPRRTDPDRGAVSSAAAMQGTVTMLETTFPASLDPQLGDSPQSAEADWVVYTGLLTRAHRGGAAGAALIPGLATTLPRVGDHGLTDALTLRPGLVFSDGRAVRASDFAATLERAVRLWPGAPRYLDATVVGAAAFAGGRARRITGVDADDRTGRIVIHLTAPDPGFAGVLAEPALGLVPGARRIAAAVHPRDPPPGCGPYVIRRVVPGHGYALQRNPDWRPLPGIPAGHVDIDVRISPDAAADTAAVLNDTADLLGWTVPVSARTAVELHDKAAGRFDLVDTGEQTDYIFLDHSERPFSSADARRAVVTALDRARLARLAGDTVTPACLLLGASLTPPSRCPAGGSLARARELVRRSGMEGQPVLVWSPRSSPQRAWMANYTSLLDRIGFRAALQTVAAAAYAAGPGAPGSDAQTGVASLRHATDPIGIGPVLDPGVAHALVRLGRTAAAGSAPWRALDAAIARRADVAVIGNRRFPFLVSARMDAAALGVNPVYGWDFTALQLK